MGERGECLRRLAQRPPKDPLPHATTPTHSATPPTRTGIVPWEIVADLFGQPVSEGLLEAAVTGCTTALAETETSIKQGLARAAVVHFDETGMSVEGKSMWLHSASTPQVTHYACHAQRGATAPKAIGILPTFGGRAIHDGFSSYWQ